MWNIKYTSGYGLPLDTFLTDIKVIIDTVKTVLSHDGVVLNALEDFDEYRKHQQDADTQAP